MNLDQLFTQIDTFSGTEKPALPGRQKPLEKNAAPDPEKQFLRVLVAAVAMAKRQKAALTGTGDDPPGQAVTSSLSAGPDSSADRSGATENSDSGAIDKKDAILNDEAALLWTGLALPQAPGGHAGLAVAGPTQADQSDPDTGRAGRVLSPDSTLAALGTITGGSEPQQPVIGNSNVIGPGDASYRDADGRGQSIHSKTAPDTQWTGDANVGKAFLSAGAVGSGFAEMTDGTAGKLHTDQPVVVENKPAGAESGHALSSSAAGVSAEQVESSDSVESAASQADGMHRSAGIRSQTANQITTKDGFLHNRPAASGTQPAGSLEQTAVSTADTNGNDPTRVRQPPLSDSRNVSLQSGQAEHPQAAEPLASDKAAFDQADRKGEGVVEDAVERPLRDNDTAGPREIQPTSVPKMTAGKTGTGTGPAGRDSAAAPDGNPSSLSTSAEERPETEKPPATKDNAASPMGNRDTARSGTGEQGALHSAAKVALEQQSGDRKGPDQAAEKESSARVSDEPMSAEEADAGGMTADRPDSAVRGSSGPGERDPGVMPEQRPVMNPAAREAAGASNRTATETEASAESRPLSAEGEQFQKVLRLNQIVDKAALQIKQGASEIQIELKPEFLGRVRMQISADNNQVAVKIMAELPAVREIIESNLSQLKTDLQNQGVNVNQLDVAVFSDSQRKGRRGQTFRPAAANKIGKSAEGDSDDAHTSTERVPDDGQRNPNGISFFA